MSVCERGSAARCALQDLTAEDIAAIEASEMEPGFEHIDAEFEAE